jgi:hypothetical protein
MTPRAFQQTFCWHKWVYGKSEGGKFYLRDCSKCGRSEIRLLDFANEGEGKWVLQDPFESQPSERWRPSL